MMWSILLFILGLVAGCDDRAAQIERDKANCLEAGDPDGVVACLRSRGWHDAKGLRNN